METLSLEKLSYVEVRDQYKVKTSNRFAASENLSDREDINRIWGTLKRISNFSYRESRSVRNEAA